MTLSNELTPLQEALSHEIERICYSIHGAKYIPNWEFSLFRACVGRESIPSLDYLDMARMIRRFRDLNGWVTRVNDSWTFVDKEAWLTALKARENPVKENPHEVKAQNRRTLIY